MIQGLGYDIQRALPSYRKLGKEVDLRFNIAEILIDHELGRSEDPVVVQIGAFDGKSNDFVFEYIKRHKARAILVEPQPEPFKHLIENYSGFEGVVFENIAVDRENGKIPLFRIKERFHSSFRLAPQLASFDKQHLVNALSQKGLVGLPDNVLDAIESIPVKCMTMDSLLEKHSVERVDVLQIDTEGFDYEIIKMIDFSKWRPGIINFEIVHLDHATLDESIGVLFSNGYAVMIYGINMLAMQRMKTSVDTHFYTSQP
jgi:FkbM family methyltransferase